MRTDSDGTGTRRSFNRGTGIRQALGDSRNTHACPMVRGSEGPGKLRANILNVRVSNYLDVSFLASRIATALAL